MSDNFMSICPRSNSYLDWNIQGIPLRVLISNGVDLTPDIDFKSTKLNNGVKYHHNASGECDSFTIKCLFKETDIIQGRIETELGYELWNIGGAIWRFSKGWDIQTKQFNVMDVLDYYIRNAEKFYITTEAIGINSNDLWLITENKNRKQVKPGFVEWSLTFTKWIPVSYATFKNTNKNITQALKNYENQKAQKTAKNTAKKTTTAKSKTVSTSKLSKCKYTTLKYSKTKKKVTCVIYLQEVLKKKGYYTGALDGWYYTQTKKAVKKFQEKNKKTYSLKVNGNVDKATFNALCGISKK